jgi:phenylpropionate dioxygenase-like ring-hydroxylating dioxygenase large terminal subunit
MTRPDAPSRLAELLASYDGEAPLEEAWALPAPFYVDREVFSLERRAVFAASWQLVARTEQLREPGQFVTAEVAGEPLVVVRGQDGELRGFFNVCRHHAAAVVCAAEGTLERMRCPYHGWTYGLDGALRAAPGTEGIARFALADHGLVPVAVDVWDRFVFASVEPPTAPLAASLGARFLREFAALPLGPLRFAGRRTWTIACNWKVFVDNYLDGGYHVPFLHKGLGSVLSFKDYAITCFDRVCLQTSPVEAAGSDAAFAAVRKGFASYFWIHPNLMLNAYAGHLDTNLVIPLGVDSTRVVFDFYLEDAPGAAHAESIEVSARIQEEDLGICESVQRGLGSRAYRSGRLAPRREAGEHLFHRLLVDDLRRAVRVSSPGP